MEVGRLIVLLVMTAVASLSITPVRGGANANPAIGSNMIQSMLEQSSTASDIGVKQTSALNNDKGERR